MIRSQKELVAVGSAEKALIPFLPYSSEIAPGVIKLTQSNGYVATWEFDGLAFETSSAEEIKIQNQALHQFILGLAGGGYAIWTHEIHSRVTERLSGQMTHEYSAKLAQAYSSRLDALKQMRTRLFMTIVYRPNQVATLGKVGMGSFKAMASLEKDAVEVLEAVGARLESSLKKYKPRRLAWYTKETTSLNGVAQKGLPTGKEAQFSEQVAFLGYLVNGHWQEYPVINKPIKNFLATTRWNASDRSGLVQLIQRDGTQRYVSSFEIKEFPSSLDPMSLAEVLYLEQEYVQTQSFSILHSRDAMTRIKRMRGRMLSGGEASQSETDEFKVAVDALIKGEHLFGEFHYNIAVFSESVQDIKDDRAAVLTALEGQFFKGELQSTLPEAALLHQLPGNWVHRTRDAMLTSMNFAEMSPLHNFMTGKKSGNPWGEAVCVLDSPSGQPFFFNFHCSPEDHDSTDEKLPGNTCIFGQTGAGKTTLEMFLMCHLNKFHARIFVLDMDHSTEVAVRRMGGIYRDLLRGQPTGINPFQWPDGPVTRAFCRHLVTHIMEFGRAKLGPDDENKLSAAIDDVFSQPLEVRRLALLAQFLSNTQRDSLQAKMTRWIGDGDLAWVLDNPQDTLDLQGGDIFAFDFSEFIDDPQICPVMTMCLLHIFEQMLDGRPLALFMEEFWKLLSDPVFTDFARDKLKTIRKENGIVIMTTQQTDDVLSTPLSKTAVQQSVTGIFLPNPKGNRSDYVDGFGLTDAEFQLVRSLPVESRAFLVKQESRSAIVRLDLSGMADVIAVLSADVQTVGLLAEIRAQVGEEALSWENIFIERVREKREGKRQIQSQAKGLK
jgi:type IV secretion system protein VirB4